MASYNFFANTNQSITSFDPTIDTLTFAAQGTDASQLTIYQDTLTTVVVQYVLNGAVYTTTLSNGSLIGGLSLGSFNGSQFTNFLGGGLVRLSTTLLAQTLTGGTGNDYIAGDVGSDSLTGSAGNDTLYGYESADTLNGGTGNDSLWGDIGNDTYTFVLGDGSDTVYDSDNTPGNSDTISFAAVNSSAATFFRLMNNDLQINYSPTNIVTVNNYFGNSNAVVENIKFSNVTLNETAVKSITVTQGTINDDIVYGYNGATNTIIGNSGADYIAGGDQGDTLEGDAGVDFILGNAGNDTMSGGTGNDQLQGGVANDTYTFSAGDGIDTILDTDSTAGNSDTVQFLNIAESDVDPLTCLVRSGNDLIFSYTQTDQIVVVDYFALNGSVIEKFQFSNGTFWDETFIKNWVTTYGTANADVINGYNDAANFTLGLGGNDTISGGNLNDFLYGGAADGSVSGNDVLIGQAGDDTIYGEDGNDTLSGGRGNDYLDGGVGNDTYLFSSGDGIDTITDLDTNLTNFDTVRFTDVKSTEAKMALVGANMEISYGANFSDKVIISNYTNPSYKIEQITFSDGVTPTLFFNTAGNDTFDGVTANDIVSYANATGGVKLNLALTTPQNNGTSAGTDTLTGIDGLIGGNYNDSLTGGTGNDTLTGGLGVDTLTGDAGNDTYVVNVISTGVLEDTVVETASNGTDTLIVQGVYGGAVKTITAPVNVEVIDISATGASPLNVTASVAGTNVTLIGNAAKNVLTGSTGNNNLTGGAGADTLTGGGGNDTYNVNITAAGLLEDTVTGGAGVDTIVATGTSSNATATKLTAGTTIENYDISGTAISKLNLTGNTLVNILTGNAGNNEIDGLAGADAMLGGLGDDSYVVDNIGDRVTENAGEGTDLITSFISFNLLINGANVENLTLTGTTPINGTGNNLNNIITGNTGINTLAGGLGDDTYFVQNTSDGVVVGDVVVENANEGTDTVNSAVTFVLGDNIENLNLTGNAIINGKGNSLSNVLTGNSTANVLNDGGLTNVANNIDTLIGGDGNDTYVINNIADIITEFAGASSGTDTISTTLSYVLNSLNVENVTLTGLSNVDATGNAGANLLTGNAANNVLTGGLGADTLIGGGGTDTYNVNLTLAGDLEDTVTGNTGSDTIIVAGLSTNGAVKTLTVATTIDNYNVSATGFSLLNVTGNILTNILTGNNANNTISDGGIGGFGDSLIGGLGGDTYIVNNSTDKIIELVAQGTDTITSAVSYDMSLNALNVENLTLSGINLINGTGNNDGNTLIGNSAINTLIGNGGDDILIGKAGNDILTGGAGADTFWYDTAAATTNKDTIADFVSGVDKLQFSVSVLTALGSTGQFIATDPRFWSNTTGVAQHTSDRLIYNTTNGNLSYDPDGSGTKGVPIIIEVITGHPTLIASDIYVV